MSRRVWALLTALLLLGVWGCAPGGDTAPTAVLPPPSPTAPPAPTLAGQSTAAPVPTATIPVVSFVMETPTPTVASPSTVAPPTAIVPAPTITVQSRSTGPLPTVTVAPAPATPAATATQPPPAATATRPPPPPPTDIPPPAATVTPVVPSLPATDTPAAPPPATDTAVVAPPAPTDTPAPAAATATVASAAPVIIGDLPRFAVDPIDQTSPDAVAALQASGAQMIRVYVSWATLEPVLTSPPAYHWDVYDAAFAHFTAAGLRPILSIQDCPPWACANSNGPTNTSALPGFAAFMTAIAGHYSAAPYHIHYWEFFNEPDATYPPDGQPGWGRHGDQYAAMLRAVVPGVRALDPQARILLGGLAYEWFSDENPNPGPFYRNFLRDVVAAGGGAYFDYLNFHYYPQNPHFPTLADKAAALRDLAHSLGIDKPLICTEVGLTSSTDPRWRAPGWPVSNEAVQSRYVARAFVEGLAGGLTSITWFSLHDWESTNPGLQIFLQTGLTHEDWTPKPALSAYHTLVREVGARPFLQRLDAVTLGTPVLDGYAFGTASDALWVVWSRVDTPAALIPPAGLAHAYDLYGTALPVTGASLSIGPDAVYLEVHQ